MAKDPVCGMYVKEGPDALRASVRGTTYYFCSKACQDTFLSPEIEVRDLRRITAFSFILGVPLLFLSLADMLGLEVVVALLSSLVGLEFWLFLLATPVQFIAGRRFYSGFLDAVKSRSANMDTLIAIGTSAAWGYSTFVTFFPQLVPSNARAVYFDTAALIIGFILLGKLLEHSMKRRATDAVRKLLDLQLTSCQ